MIKRLKTCAKKKQ